MGKKEKNQNLHDQVRQERKIQREESVAEERKKTSPQENSQEKTAEAKKKQKRKIAVLAGCCGVLAVASVCLITALGRPANDPQKAIAVSVQSVPESSDEKSEIAEVTVTKVPERTDKKQETGNDAEKDEEDKDQKKDSEKKTETNASASSEEEKQERQTDTAAVTTETTNTTEQQRHSEETTLPAAKQTDSVVSEPSASVGSSSVTAVPESIPQETTMEITPEPTPLPHVHSWVTKFRTVHHDAVTEEVKVVDQPAYTEPVYEEKPVYETIAVYICDVCGEEFESEREHSESHIDWETFTNPFHYHVEFRQGAQTGTEMVQTGSITHHEVSHMETRVVKAACDEEVPDGYVCTGCGAVK